MESSSISQSKGLENAIFFLENCVSIINRGPSRVDALKLACLCRSLKKTKTTAMRLFRKKLHKTAVFSKCVLRRVHYYEERWVIIRGLLVECFLRGLTDNDAIAEVLRLLDLCPSQFYTEGSIGKDICFLYTEQPQIIAESSLNNQTRALSTSFLSYILYHANESRVIVKDKRFIDLTSLNGNVSYYWVSQIESDVLLKFLQYGARLSDTKRISVDYVPEAIVKTLYALINIGVECGYWDKEKLLCEVQPLERIDKVKNICACFRILLRETLNPHQTTFFLAGQRQILSTKLPKHGELVIPNLPILLPFYDKLFPDCLYGRRIPPSLRHMCRFAVRQILHHNWKVPDGIECLPVPVVLKNYLNLLDD